jgi:hypothetical protein
MAKRPNPKKKASNVVTMEPESAGNVAIAEIEPETPFDGPPPPITSPALPLPAPAAPSPSPQKRNPSFFERAQAIPKVDWGTRAFIYVYCLEPICNLKMGGESKYLVRLSEPIADEQALMVDYGSGKYRLQLVNRKAGANNSDAIDTKEIEIYNPKYPPKIPRAVWMNDPRNERWAALLPKEEPPAPATGLGTLTEAFKTFGEIRKDLREELTPAPAPPAPPAPPPVDPMEAGLRIANMMMTLKADNPMNEFYRDEMKALRDELKEERAETRRLLAEARKPAPEGEKFGIKQAITEFKGLLPDLKEMFPGMANAAGEITRGRTNGWDILRDTVTSVAPTLIDYAGKIALAYATRMPTPQNGQQTIPPNLQLAAPQGSPQPNGQPPAAGQQTPAQPQQMPPKFFIFLSQPTVRNALMKYFTEFKNGDIEAGMDFAQWASDADGAEVLQDGRSLGSATIIGGLKNSPFWPLFAADEGKLVAFVDQVLAWSPPPADTPDGGDGGDDDDDDGDGAVDLTRRGV